MSNQRNLLSRAISRFACLLIVAAIALPGEAQTESVKELKLAKTADELLKLIDDTKSYHPRPAYLSAAEAKLAAEKLRERFPFESIRERMAFQGPVDEKTLTKLGPKKIVSSTPNRLAKRVQGKAVQGKSKLKLKSISPKHVMHDGRPSRTIALERLHADEVEGFINSPGNGFFRTRTISPYDLSPGSYAKSFASRPVGSGILGESVIELKPLGEDRSRFELSDAGMPTTDLIKLFNQRVTGYFAMNTGLVQGLDKVAGFEPHRTRLQKDWKQNLRTVDRKHYEHLAGADINWKVNRIQLVSLLLHDEPRVYVSENLPNMEELSGSDVETRALDDFETTALEKMKQDETLVHRASHNRILMMGSVRATESCLQCHAVKENELLGAFSYEFLRDPQSKPTKSEL